MAWQNKGGGGVTNWPGGGSGARQIKVRKGWDKGQCLGWDKECGGGGGAKSAWGTGVKTARTWGGGEGGKEIRLLDIIKWQYNPTRNAAGEQPRSILIFNVQCLVNRP